jgi:hypothetical protein
MMNLKTNLRILFTQDFEDIPAGTKLTADIIKETEDSVDLELESGEQLYGIPMEIVAVHTKDVVRVKNQIALSN